MLALIAGQGRLPVLLARRLAADGTPFRVFEMAGFAFDNPDGLPVTGFRVEQLGSLLDTLVGQGFDAVCFAGAIRRPTVDVALVDDATKPLLGKIFGAIAAGDDAALRAIIALFSERGMTIRAAHDIVPQLLPDAGVPTRAQPGPDRQGDLKLAHETLAKLGAADVGQACVIAAGQLIASEARPGTDAMLGSLDPAATPAGGFLFKGPKPDQDRRIDLPTIGVHTVKAVQRANLAGIVIRAGGVLVLDLADVVAACDDAGLFLWIAEAS